MNIDALGEIHYTEAELKETLRSREYQILNQIGFIDVIQVRNYRIMKMFTEMRRQDPQRMICHIYEDLANEFHLSEWSISKIISTKCTDI